MLSFSKHFGSKPVNWLFDKSSNAGELILQNKGEISPLNVLMETSYVKMDGGGTGIGPFSMFPERSIVARLTQGRVTEGLRLSKPVNELLDKFKYHMDFVLMFQTQ